MTIPLSEHAGDRFAGQRDEALRQDAGRHGEHGEDRQHPGHSARFDSPEEHQPQNHCNRMSKLICRSAASR